MERKIIAGILLISVALFVIGMLIPSGTTVRKVKLLPWDIVVTQEGESQVFSLTLGHSTLADAERVFQEEAKLQLFIREGDRLSAEAFFEETWLAGLKAKVVVNLAIPEETLREMYQRGERIAKSSSGSSRVTLSDEDAQTARLAPIDVLTYMPRASLDEPLLISRFGAPAERFVEEKDRVLHLLYPSKGLDISLHSNGKAVMQYITPRDFPRLAAPLREAPSPPAEEMEKP